MDDDENLPRNSNDPVALLVKQDLDPLSVDELDQRISLLESEISRLYLIHISDPTRPY